MFHSPWRQGFAAVFWLALVVGMSTAVALAAPPVQFGTPMPLDRLGSLPFNPHPRGILAVGNGADSIAMCWHATTTLIQARVYKASGPPRTPVIEVTRKASPETQVGLDLDPAGNLLVAWIRDYDASTQLGTLMARRFGGDGTPITGEMVVATGVVGHPFSDFLVVQSADGGFAALWQRGSLPPSGLSLVARAFGRDGQPKGPEAVVSQTPNSYFPNIALALDGDRALVAYGVMRQSGSNVVSDLWARWLNGTGAPTSGEIAVALPPLPFGGYEPIGARILPTGGFTLTYELCDPVSFDDLCSRTGVLEANAAGAILASREVNAPMNGFRSDASRVATDPLGNFGMAALGAPPSLSDFAALNPLDKVATQATLPASSVPPGSTLAGLVALAPAQFGLVWYQDDWTYFQSIAVGNEITPAPFFYTVEPCRLLDTRTGEPLRGGEDLAVPASGQCSIPAGARALAANVVSVESTDAGNLRVYRPDQLVTATSTLNYGPGQVRANSSVIALDDGGTLALRATQATGTTHVIVDVSGYFQ
jgi:hypothetical protein